MPDSPLSTRLIRGVLMLAVSAGVLGGMVSVASAVARDADGARMQARTIKVGETQKDSLRPPSDQVDWRSLKVSEAGNVTVSLSHAAKQGPVSLRLTDSRGQSRGAATSARGSASIGAELKPGIYYISVSSKTSVSYSLSVR